MSTYLILEKDGVFLAKNILDTHAADEIAQLQSQQFKVVCDSWKATSADLTVKAWLKQVDKGKRSETLLDKANATIRAANKRIKWIKRGRIRAKKQIRTLQIWERIS